MTGIAQFFQNCMSDHGAKMMPHYNLLKKDSEFENTEEHRKSLTTLKKDLPKTTEKSLRLAKPGLLYAVICDAGTELDSYCW